MKRLSLVFLGVVGLCGVAFTLSSCAGGYVGVDAGPGYYDDGPWVYGGGWYGGGWGHGWAHPGWGHDHWHR